MTDLTPIQTEYNGHHFRSRLEARWAVFFDALGVKFEYEAEGYNLEGEWYLPDFWLPEIRCYVEIKPVSPADGILLHRPLLRLAEQSKCYGLAVHGNPWPGEYEVALHGIGHYIFGDSKFAPGEHRPNELWLYGDFGAFCINRGSDEYDFPDTNSARLDDAYRAARSARFEHGEKGRTL